MIPYESAFLVLSLAAISLINGAFERYRWFSFLCLGLAALGIAGLAGPDPVFEPFYIFSPQIVILLAIAVFYCATVQRVLLSVLATAVLAAVLLTQMQPDGFGGPEGNRLALFLACALLPAFIFRVRVGTMEKVERLISIQQLWLRLTFLFWCRRQLAASPPDVFYGASLEILTGVAAAIFFLRIAPNRSTWALSSQSLFSLIFLLSALSMGPADMKFLLAVTVAIGLTGGLPVEGMKASGHTLHRMNLGGFGGASFWGMCFFLLLAPMDAWLRVLWILVVLLAAYAAQMLPLTATEASSNQKLQRGLLYFGFFLQAIFFGLILFWPEMKGMGV